MKAYPRGYKVFNNDWTCLNMQYKVGETYTMDEEPIMCKRGFHYCTDLIDCFNYYPFDPDKKVAEIEVRGDVVRSYENTKCCTNCIKILREIPWSDVINIVGYKEDNYGIKVKEIICADGYFAFDDTQRCCYCLSPIFICDLQHSNLKINDNFILDCAVWTVISKDEIRCNTPFVFYDCGEEVAMEKIRMWALEAGLFEQF